MTHPYKTREGGATVTIFVPYDCRNHCPFCVNKQEYAHAEGFSVEAILKSIAVMDEITPRCDFVFTGGEPFANLKALQRMLDAIPTTHKVYINTTFPVQPGCSAEEMIAFTERNRDKITCINISRHLTKYVEESPDEVVARVATPKRVNCVLYMDYPADELVDYAERWRKYNIPVQFRYDYTETTPENLYQEEGDKILADLKKRFTYKGAVAGITAGAGMYLIMVLSGLIMIVMIVIFSRRQINGKIFVAIIHCTKDCEDKVLQSFGRMRYQVKSRTIRNGKTELAVELFSKDGNPTLGYAIDQIDGVDDVTLIQYNGEYHG